MHINAISKNLIQLPLEVASRINERFISSGIIFREWDNEEKQAELRYAYTPLAFIKNIDRTGKKIPNETEDSIVRKFYTALDTAGVNYYPDKTKEESVAESLTDFIIAANKNPLIPFKVEGFRKIRFWEKLQGAYKR